MWEACLLSLIPRIETIQRGDDAWTNSQVLKGSWRARRPTSIHVSDLGTVNDERLRSQAYVFFRNFLKLKGPSRNAAMNWSKALSDHPKQVLYVIVNNLCLFVRLFIYYFHRHRYLNEQCRLHFFRIVLEWSVEHFVRNEIAAAEKSKEESQMKEKYA